MVHPDLGTQLRQWRKHLSISQADLEEEAGLGHNTVSRIERGESNPTSSTVVKLANALKISFEQLIIGSPPNRQTQHKGKSFKDRIKNEIKNLSENECREIYPVWEKLIGLIKKREEY